MDEQSSSGPVVFSYSAAVIGPRVRDFARRFKDETGEPWLMEPGGEDRYVLSLSGEPIITLFPEPINAETCTVGVDFDDTNRGRALWAEIQRDLHRWEPHTSTGAGRVVTGTAAFRDEMRGVLKSLIAGVDGRYKKVHRTDVAVAMGLDPAT